MRLADRVDAVFANGGRLADELIGFEPRPAQREMAAAVANALEEGGVLLAEAGTGTGKTLAYLVPAILKGEPVLVSTGTKNLQEQIFEKDIPLLRKTLGLPVTATCMKGRSNYLCLHRFDNLQNDLAANGAPVSLPGLTGMPDLGRVIERLRTWIPVTETGDRAELEDLPEDLPVWKDIAASAENCLGTECPRFHECYVTRMRQRAADSDVVIVNHHLLFADAAVRQRAYGEVIPDIPHAVLDEAHQLEDVATQYFGVIVSSHRVEELTSDVDRWASRVLHGRQRDAVQSGADHVRRHARRLFTGLDGQRTGPEERIRLTQNLLAGVADIAADLTGTIDGLLATLQLLRQVPDGQDAAITGEALEELTALARRAGELKDDTRFLLRASDSDFVYFLEVRGRSVYLRAAPIAVAHVVRDTVLDRRRTTVLTSATMAIEQSFEYIRARLGVGKARELLLSSEFDHAKQALLYLPRRMPSPKSSEFQMAAAHEIGQILHRTEGRAFVLFTSYVMLRATRLALDGTLPFPILVQGDAPRSALLTRFRQTPHAVLFATSSFWQGVDVVGEALSCVIVDKLPFASPGDPITAARLETIAEQGGDPFADFQVPLAILTLRQGLGRLLRHRTDRGVLAVLDPRLRTMGYGRRFLTSLPPAPVTSDLDAIQRFFRQ
jgi:ATP-dependent DNA helicase DinG